MEPKDKDKDRTTEALGALSALSGKIDALSAMQAEIASTTSALATAAAGFNDRLTKLEAAPAPAAPLSKAEMAGRVLGAFTLLAITAIGGGAVGAAIATRNNKTTPRQGSLPLTGSESASPAQTQQGMFVN